MASHSIHVLVIEDDPEDFLIIQRLLSKCSGCNFQVEQVSDYKEAVKEVARRAHDVYLVDYRLGSVETVDLIREAIGDGHPGPFLVLTGQGDHDVDVQASEAGAADYLVKGEITGKSLERSIRYALERNRLLEQLQDRAREHECLYRIAHTVESEDEPSDVLAKIAQILGESLKVPPDWNIEISYGDDCYRYGAEGDQQVVIRRPLNVNNEALGEIRVRCPEGEQREILEEESFLIDSAARSASGFIAKWLDQQKIEELARLPSESPNPVIRVLADGRVAYANKSASRLLTFWNCQVEEKLPPAWVGYVQELLETGQPRELELESENQSFSLLFSPVPQANYVNIYATDITRRRHVERTLAERASLAALVAEVGLLLTRGDSLRDAMQGCADAIVAHSGARVARIWRVTTTEQQLVLEAAAGVNARGIPQSRVSLDNGPLGWVVRHRERYVADPIRSDPLFENWRSYQNQGLAAFAGFPVIVHQQLIGVLELYAQKSWSLEALGTFPSIADAIGLGIEQKETELSRRRMVALLEATPDFVAISDTNYGAVYLNRSGRRMLGLGPHDDISKLNILNIAPAWAQQILTKEALPVVFTKGVWRGDSAITSHDGREIPVSQVILAHVSSAGDVEYISTIARDMSEPKALEEQLRQSQKLEGIGRLAGGVAHDFNNLLTGIRGFADLALQSIDDPSVAQDLTQIRDLSDRAADLTKQLLAFSRRQPMSPVVTNINELVEKTSRLLKRLIGEDIELKISLDPELGNVRVDKGQIEQILVNLAVNARDAMPHGGRLLIETKNAYLSQEYTRRHAGVIHGKHVMLAVTDTGTGMDEETKEHIFEPFFTTKPIGQGTGLGLSTVYGIVKQQQGSIWVYSELGKGTTFKIYFPHVPDSAISKEPAETPNILSGNELILVVEDEDAVREVTRRILTGYGYRVICASNGHEARQLFLRDPLGVSLLLTDVVMPGIGGRQLFEQLSSMYPHLRVLYMSGYTDSAIVHHGVLDSDTPYIQKPFNAVDLVRRVREILD